MATMEQFFTGKHLYSVILTAQARDATGAFTPSGTSRVLISGTSSTSGVLAGCTHNGQSVLEDLAPISSPRENLVPVLRNDRVTLTEIMRVNAAQNQLAACFMETGCEYAEVVIRRGQAVGAVGGDKVVAVTFIALMAEYREVITPTRKTATLELLSIADSAGTINPEVVFDTITNTGGL